MISLLSFLLAEINASSTFLNPSLVPLTPSLALTLPTNPFTSSPVALNLWVYIKSPPTTFSDFMWWDSGKFLKYASEQVYLGEELASSLSPGVWTLVRVRCGLSGSELAVGSSSVSLPSGYSGGTGTRRQDGRAAE